MSQSCIITKNWKKDGTISMILLKQAEIAPVNLLDKGIITMQYTYS